MNDTYTKNTYIHEHKMHLAMSSSPALKNRKTRIIHVACNPIYFMSYTWQIKNVTCEECKGTYYYKKLLAEYMALRLSNE